MKCSTKNTKNDAATRSAPRSPVPSQPVLTVKEGAAEEEKQEEGKKLEEPKLQAQTTKGRCVECIFCGTSLYDAAEFNAHAATHEVTLPWDIVSIDSDWEPDPFSFCEECSKACDLAEALYDDLACMQLCQDCFCVDKTPARPIIVQTPDAAPVRKSNPPSCPSFSPLSTNPTPDTSVSSPSSLSILSESSHSTTRPYPLSTPASPISSPQSSTHPSRSSSPLSTLSPPRASKAPPSEPKSGKTSAKTKSLSFSTPLVKPLRDSKKQAKKHCGPSSPPVTPQPIYQPPSSPVSGGRTQISARKTSFLKTTNVSPSNKSAPSVRYQAPTSPHKPSNPSLFSCSTPTYSNSILHPSGSFFDTPFYSTPQGYMMPETPHATPSFYPQLPHFQPFPPPPPFLQPLPLPVPPPIIYPSYAAVTASSLPPIPSFSPYPFSTATNSPSFVEQPAPTEVPPPPPLTIPDPPVFFQVASSGVVRAYTIRRGHKVPVSAGVVLRTLGVVSAEC